MVLLQGHQLLAHVLCFLCLVKTQHNQLTHGSGKQAARSLHSVD